MTPCSSCGQALATADILYTEDARVVCLACSSKREIVRDEQRAARNIKIAAFTCLGAALFGFGSFAIGFGLFFYAAAIVSVASGIYAGGALINGHDRFTQHMTSADKTLAWICTGLGLAVAGFETLVIAGYIPFRPFIR